MQLSDVVDGQPPARVENPCHAAALVDFDPANLAEALARSGFSRVHALPLLRAFYEGAGEIDFSRLKVGPKVEAWMHREIPLRRSELRANIRSGDGTTKLLIGFPDGGAVESVLMPAFRPDRAAGCVSSQIGCAMGCDFCASTKRGLERNLEAGEIVEQFLHLKSLAATMGRRITSLVFMGMGEPLHNLDNVILAIERIAHPQMGALGWRQITVSTVGIVPGIDRLAEANLGVHLALSLHAPDDETRARIVPSNRRYPVAQIMDAARRFQAKTGRISNIEYCMLAGVNDSDEHARMHCALMAGFRAHVNLIPYNFGGSGLSGAVYRKPSEQRVAAFLDILRAGGVVAHRRLTRGDDANAACGQLRETQFAG